jgi:streptogramin lyase
MHRELKCEATCPPTSNLRGQQRKFDFFRQRYNQERPHEGIENDVPASRWQPSPRSYLETIAKPEYPDPMEVRRVSAAGTFQLNALQLLLSPALHDQQIGLEETCDIPGGEPATNGEEFNGPAGRYEQSGRRLHAAEGFLGAREYSSERNSAPQQQKYLDCAGHRATRAQLPPPIESGGRERRSSVMNRTLAALVVAHAIPTSAAAIILAAASPAYSAPLPTGTIVVATQYSGELFAVDPATGSQTLISSGGYFTHPLVGVASESGQSVLVVNGYRAQVIRVNTTTGQQTLLSSDGGFRQRLDDIVLEPGGSILVGSWFAAELWRVDPASGAQTLVSSGGGGEGFEPYSITSSPTGDIFVATKTTGKIFHVDPLSGAQTIISSGGFFTHPLDGIAVEPGGSLVVVSNFTGQVVRVDPVTGAQQLVSEISAPLDSIAVEPDGSILVGSAYTASIFRVDPMTGNHSLVSTGGTDFDGYSIGVVSVPEPGSCTLVAFGVAGVAVARSFRSG